jgi:hypothetical protein
MLVRDLEKRCNNRDKAWKDLEKYSAVVLVGGGGPIGLGLRQYGC